ncbi:hypothetical protein [Nitrosomonas ureae]|uniref:Uncharacterized protein n=1 Tax=Nitrosomonas ureae TaxID=44577 RepID=A0A1H2DTM5_9PROT|nr:hypothetical protein [Nitrosomonas ureae]ALQ50509.1 hypothetical protein ATY38_04215 [Nitrosomonas ureae]SDT86233.1 hypothetical protein SAMN05216406_10633 [Nitrosomonas ureae]
MNNNEAAFLIQTMLKSMRENPAQFNFTVNVTTVGAMGIGGPGGAGIVGIANGSGVGVYASASASAPSQMQIQISEQRANQELNAQFTKIQSILESIITELENTTISREKSETFIGKLKSTWLPNVVIATIAAILEQVFG